MICRAPDDSFAAGWDDGADDPPLSREQRARLAALLRPIAPGDERDRVIVDGDIMAIEREADE